ERGDVVDQRVEPDVGEVLVVERQRDSPLQTLARPANRQILQGIPKEAEDLVAIALRADHVWPALDLIDQPLLVFRHLEEVVLLLDVGQRAQVIGALAVHDLLLRIETLAAEAILAPVRAEVDLTRFPERLQNPLHDVLVPLFGRADEVIIDDAETLPRVSEAA